MNTKSIGIFDDEPDTPTRPDAAALRALAEASGFPSRQRVAELPPRAAKPAPWRYRTGRTEQFNVKASAHTIARCEALAQRINGPKAVVLELAIAALERELEAVERAGQG